MDTSNFPDWTHNIPNFDKLLEKLNITFSNLDHLLKEHNVSIWNQQPTNLLDTGNLHLSIDNENDSGYFNKDMVLSIFVLYILSVALFPMLNNSKKMYGYMTDEFKYKILWPVVFGIVMVPVMTVKVPYDMIRMLFVPKSNLHSLRDVFDNNRIRVERDDDHILRFNYGKLEKENYPDLIVYDQAGYPMANGHNSCNHEDEI